jgi:photosystem II stability/assembly factor-like uncharacterized protein
MGRRRRVFVLCCTVATAFVLASAVMADTSFAGASVVAKPLLVSLDFISASRGWAAGAGRVLRTTDGGATWRASALPGIQPSVGPIGFWNRSDGCAVDMHGGAWRTRTGGRTWLRRGPAEPGGEYAGLALLGPSRAWVTRAYVRDDDEHTEAYSFLSSSSDDGDSWSPKPGITAAGGALTDLDFVSYTSGWGVGCQVVPYEDSDGNPRGYNVALIARTDDAGATWPVTLGPAELGITQRWSHLWAVDFKGGVCGWAVGDAGRNESPRVGLILRTVDGGATWTAGTFDHFWSFLHVSMATTKVGWATADTAPSWKSYRSARNRILKTTDGGRTWRVQHLPRGLHAVDVDAVSATIALAAGTSGPSESRGMVARTTDGGAHWVRVW